MEIKPRKLPVCRGGRVWFELGVISPATLSKYSLLLALWPRHKRFPLSDDALFGKNSWSPCADPPVFLPFYDALRLTQLREAVLSDDCNRNRAGGLRHGFSGVLDAFLAAPAVVTQFVCRSSIFLLRPPAGRYIPARPRLNALTRFSPIGLVISSVRPSAGHVLRYLVALVFKGSYPITSLLSFPAARFQSLQYSTGWGTPAGRQLRSQSVFNRFAHSPAGRAD